MMKMKKQFKYILALTMCGVLVTSCKRELLDPVPETSITDATSFDTPDRILNQEEIDGLLGFSIDELVNGSQSGIRAIIDSAMVSYERVPMLEILFDRFVRLLTTSLRNFTSDNVEVSLDSITAIRFGDYLNSIPLPAMLGVMKAEEWDNFGLIMVDSSLTYSIVV